MNFLNKIVDKFRIDTTDFEDENDMDYYEEDEDFDSETTHSQSSKYTERRDDYYFNEEPVNKSKMFSKPKVTPVRHNTGMEVVLVRPNTFEDAKVVCDYLKSGKAVVLNMEGLNIEIAQRIIDFSAGTIYYIDGKLQKISKNIFIVTPKTIDLSGEFQDLASLSTYSKMGGASYGKRQMSSLNATNNTFF